MPRPSEMAAAEYARMAAVEDSHWWYRTLRRLVRDALSRHGPADGTARLLDAGSGTGSGLATWSRTVDAIGLDVSAEALRHAARRGPRRLVQGSIEALPLGAGSFDAIVSLDVLCLAGIDEDRALAELHRVLRPGGILVVNLPAFESLRGQHDAAVRVRRRYRRTELAGALRRAGFEPVQVFYWNTLMYPLVWLVRRLRTGGQGRSPTSDLASLPSAANAALAGLLWLEMAALRGRAPFGTSVLSIARKPRS